MTGFFSELKRRRVYQSAAIYAVVAWGLAQAVDFVAERLFMPDWVPTLTAIVFVVGFPVAVFLSWVFDIGPDGIRREGVGRVKGATSIAAAIVMLVGGTALIYSIVWPRHQAEVNEALAAANSVAVLPFALQGETAGNEYLSDGMAEEILYAMSALTDIRVAARTSSFSFRGQDITASEIAEALDVRHLVEGSIRLVGDTIRVNVSLVRGDTDLPLWSKTYEEPADDIFRVQEDIAFQVADAIREEMGAEATGERPRFRAVSENSDAYRLYLQGRFVWHQRGAQNIRASIAFFEQALELEPEFAGAWAGLASAYLTSRTYAAGIEDAIDLAVDAANRAIELDTTIGEPYGILAQAASDARDLARSQELIERGISLSPQNTTLRLWLATFLIQYGRSLDANRQAAIALERDPAYPIVQANFGFSSFHLGKLDDARHGMEQAWNLGVRPWFIWYGILDVMVDQGDFESARAWFDSAPPLRDPVLSRPSIDLTHAWVDTMEAGTAESRAEFDRLLDAYLANPVHGLTRPIYMTSALGNAELAISLLQRQIDDDGRTNLGQLWVPGMASIRMHRSFNDVAESTGLVDYWKTVAWPDKCGPEDGAVVCYR